MFRCSIVRIGAIYSLTRHIRYQCTVTDVWMIKSALGTCFIYCPWSEDCERRKWTDRLCTKNVGVSSRMMGCSTPFGTRRIEETTSTAVLELVHELVLELQQELVLCWEQAGPMMRWMWTSLSSKFWLFQSFLTRDNLCACHFLKLSKHCGFPENCNHLNLVIFLL